MSSAAEAIGVSVAPTGVVTIRLDRPERRNAFDDDMLIRLGALFTDECRAAGVRLVVIEGAGPFFCSGFDIGSRSRLGGEAGMRMVAETFHALATIPAPTLAVVQGGAFGGGLGLVAACDIAIGASDAIFASPEARHGIVPAAIMPYLIRALGERRATAMMLSGARMSAADALSSGLLFRIAEADALAGERDALIGELLKGAPEALKAIKTLAPELGTMALDDALLDRTALLAAQSRRGAEAREGFAAFAERRRPAWNAT